jgi:hypothetical protein
VLVTERLSVGCDDLECSSIAESRRRNVNQDFPWSNRRQDRELGDVLCLAPNSRIHLPSELAPHDEKSDRRRENNRDGNRTCREKNQPGSEAHRPRESFPRPARFLPIGHET